MARIKITDLPKDTKVSEEELRRVWGGGIIIISKPAWREGIRLSSSPRPLSPLEMTSAGIGAFAQER